MEHILDILQRGLFAGLTILFFSDATVLFIRSKNNKARKTMAFVILLWALAYFFRFIGFYIDSIPVFYTLWRVNVLVIGNLFISFMFLFPVQVLVPGWLNVKRSFLLLLPFLVVSGIYYLVLSLLHETPYDLVSYRQIASLFGHFNVWYRFVILLCNFVYIISIVKWLYKYEKKYLQWKNENFADQDYIDISWMRAYILLMILITIAYIVLLAVGGQFPVIIHSIIVILSFSYLFYKALFYESPYPENFFSEKHTDTEKEMALNLPGIHSADEVQELTELSFESRIPTYVDAIRKWMEKEKPYLYKDFKLTDVSRLLPLNRSYLSRVFNEGFHMNFSEMVRFYRVEYAKEIVKRNPSLPIYKVAELSGFSSDSTFVKAFKHVTGITPTQYKQENPS